VRAAEEKIRENRRFTITSLPLHFPRISRSLFHETNLRSLHILHRNAALKRKTVGLLMAGFRRTVWLNRS